MEHLKAKKYLMRLKVVTDDPHDLFWLNKRIEFISFEHFINSPQKADLVYFSGGADVNPEVYNEITLSHTCYDPYRDAEEIKVYNLAKGLSIPFLGVCRGGQLLTALQPGGRLIQDVTGHGLGHTIKTSEGKVLLVTSTHHQMMYPFNTDHELLATSSSTLSTYYMVGYYEHQDRIIKKYGEPEVVFYPGTKALAIQGHPEYGTATRQFRRYCRSLVENKLLQ